MINNTNGRMTPNSCSRSLSTEDVADVKNKNFEYLTIIYHYCDDDIKIFKICNASSLAVAAVVVVAQLRNVVHGPRRKPAGGL